MDISVQRLYYCTVYCFIDKDQPRKDCKFRAGFWQSFERREWLLEACETMAPLISLRNVGFFFFFFFFRLDSMFCRILRRNLKAISLDRSLSVVARYSIEIYYKDILRKFIFTESWIFMSKWNLLTLKNWLAKVWFRKVIRDRNLL